jgi:hypothetical protein
MGRRQGVLQGKHILVCNFAQEQCKDDHAGSVPGLFRAAAERISDGGRLSQSLDDSGVERNP